MPHLSVEQQIIFLYTRELNSTAHFYENVLGLALARDQGDCRIYWVSQTGLVGFCQRADAPQHPSGIILTLITPDVDGWYQSLKQKGVVFEKPPALNPRYGIYHCFLRDPNGYLIEIQRFVEPL